MITTEEKRMDHKVDLQPVPHDKDKYGITTPEPDVEPKEDNSIEPGTTDGTAPNGGGH